MTTAIERAQRIFDDFTPHLQANVIEVGRTEHPLEVRVIFTSKITSKTGSLHSKVISGLLAAEILNLMLKEEIEMSTQITPSDDREAPKAEEFSGGNVNYYLVDVKQPKRLDPYKAECEDIIEALGMTFAEGTLLKALWRSCAARTLGTKKKGQDEQGLYDANKLVYYSARVLAQREKLNGQSN